MKTSCAFSAKYFAITTATMALCALQSAAQAQPVPVTKSFVDHPTNCQFFLGNPGFRGEDLSGAYSSDVVAVVNELAGTTGDPANALATMRQACLKKAVAKSVSSKAAP